MRHIIILIISIVMSEHSKLLFKAKQQQKDRLTESESLANQLDLTLNTLVRSNSSNDSNGPTVLDKITTIHEIDKEINRQLNQDIAVNYDLLIRTRETLLQLTNKGNKSLQKNEDGSIIDDFQRRSELIDQDLRILENTLRLIRRNN